MQTHLVVRVFLVTTLCMTSQAWALSPKAVRDIGEHLFFDKSLSRAGDVSCSSCHDPAHAFSDGKPVAVGTNQQRGTRNTPSLLALTQGPFFWDGRVEKLEGVVLQPFTNPAEMGLRDQAELLAKLRQSPAFKSAQAYFAGTDDSQLNAVAQALTGYVRSLPMAPTSYDRFVAGNDDALDTTAKRGLDVFRGAGGCADCHRLDGNPPSLTDEGFHSALVSAELASILPTTASALMREAPSRDRLNFQIESDRAVSELGRFVVSHNPKDIGSFRTPSLRQVAHTAPYMHDGSVATLREAVDQEIYYRGLQNNRPNQLTEDDRQALVAFLESLSSPAATVTTGKVRSSK